MSAPDSQAEALRWTRYAREDLTAAEGMNGQDTVAARHVCWLAQQAAEKAIKAGLVFLQIDFPRSHDLDMLRKLLPEGWQVERSAEDLAELSEWAVEGRYPGDWPDATQVEAQQALEMAQTVLRTMMEDLKARGLEMGG